MAKPGPRFYLSLLISLLITVLVVVPAAIVAAPHVYRWQMLHRLVGDDMHNRELALNYVIRKKDDPRVVEGAIDALQHAQDDRNFVQILNALDHGGNWRRPRVPAEAWLEWLRIVSEDENPESRILAGQHLADAKDLADDMRVHALITQLSQDDEPSVRLNAVVAAAQLAGATDLLAPYAPILKSATQDPIFDIQRHAWMFIGLLRVEVDITLDESAQEPMVAQAKVWAYGRLHSDQPQPLIDLLGDPQQQAAARAMAAYVLHLSDTQMALSAMLERAHLTSNDATPLQDLLTTRIVLGLPQALFENAAQPIIDMNALMPIWSGREVRAGSRPILLALLYRGINSYSQAQHLISQMPADPLYYLAALEGARPGQYSVPVTKEMPPMIRLAALNATSDPDPAELERLMGADEPTLRDIACVVAARRLSPQQQAQTIENLLRNYNDRAKMSGAILAGLTGLQPELLAKKHRDEDMWNVQQMMQLGLWMQGQTVKGPKGDVIDMDNTCIALLTRDDLPITSILLAMLFKQRTEAMDYLLNPRGDERLISAEAMNLKPQEVPAPDADAASEAQVHSDGEPIEPPRTIKLMPPPVTTLDLLSHYRWWFVLREFLPPAARLPGEQVTAENTRGFEMDTPELWLWADLPLQQFQVDILRNWYLVRGDQITPQWQKPASPQSPAPDSAAAPAPDAR